MGVPQATGIPVVIAPRFLRDNALQGLAWVAAGYGGPGLRPETITEARAMAAGLVTRDKAARMVAWFARHMIDLDAPAARRGAPEYPSPGVVAHALWGGGSRRKSVRAQRWASYETGRQAT